MKARILVVDDNLAMARMLADGLADQGHEGVPVASGKRAIELLSSEPFDAVITDLRIPDADGMEVLAASRRSDATRPVIIMTAFSAVDSAVDSIRQGAYHYLTKPFKADELHIFLARALGEVQLRREAEALRTTLRERFTMGGLVAESPAMRAALDVAHRVAQSAAPILITGETGTGKGVLARAVHNESPRATRAFITVNCAALPETLLESELFGHVKGAFTGAATTRAGLFVEADGGTLFLDEIGDMSLTVQAKLLDVLERGVIRPVGAERERAVDVRIVAATHRDLQEASTRGTFRADLLFRLDVVDVELPPLRTRREDLLPLLQQCLAETSARHPTSPVRSFSPAAFARLLAWRWPGNVRELKHLVERLVLLGRQPEIQEHELPPALLTDGERVGPTFAGEVLPIRQVQRLYASWALEQVGGHRGRAAEKLEVDAKTLAKWLAQD
ncbi:MAG: sigma-54 dependent transcriptional regulator [Deltaproteobacteria bacterium]|nr:sigma-54 dependent transcriptional regulator [Deltaproteobacteria bacterium]